jgi:Trypsin-like peptidase domain
MEDFSLSVARLELLASNGIQCGVGTGFFYKEGDTTYLVTNWHVVTGVNPTTFVPVDPSGPSPDILRLFYKQQITHDGRVTVRTPTHDVPLYSKGQALWLEHSARQNVDAVAIELDLSTLQLFGNVPINAVQQEHRLLPYAGMDCFVLGYPEGMIGPGLTPIWKRASIATEPQYNFRDLPGFLIDTATRSGMSGSPVVARHSGFFNPDKSKAMSPLSVIGTLHKFVGIYSGRLGDDPLEVQLGMVWRRDVLTDITNTRTPGHNPCR